MSFMLTTEQIRNQTKTVTRRLGWKFLKPGDLVQPVVKAMGLKKGEKIEKIGPPIRIVSVRRELLWDILDEPDGASKEGFPQMNQSEFVHMFCSEMRCDWGTPVTRIEFEYTE
jgi:hypothetical protein